MSLREGPFLPSTHIKHATDALAKVKAGMTDTSTVAHRLQMCSIKLLDSNLLHSILCNDINPLTKQNQHFLSVFQLLFTGAARVLDCNGWGNFEAV